ncbi:glycoside hydrolase family 35 protein [Dothistroma septosporum NZE10]|uniref:Glycoside hydrolase family 35 protein n=1 Tax=Dothistroma septosporum (strain NZE10 / CBS 128990) TaxID=675120 RepID=N1PXE7_DOTSN|nr:glycoside hydrolase family 35 protein [Dothistroma septosporum NZE10]
MDPRRIPHEYWRDRRKKARAVGLTTISPCIFWDHLEPSPGQGNFDQPGNAVTTYTRTAQEERLNVVLGAVTAAIMYEVNKVEAKDNIVERSMPVRESAHPMPSSQHQYGKSIDMG